MARFRATDVVVLVTLLCVSTQPSLGKDATLEKVFGAASHEHDEVNKTVSSGESTTPTSGSNSNPSSTLAPLPTAPKATQPSASITTTTTTTITPEVTSSSVSNETVTSSSSGRNKNVDNTTTSGEAEDEDNDPLPAKGSAEKEHTSSLAIFFVLFVLILCIFLIHFLLRYKCHYIPESLAIVFLGAAVGLFMRLLPNDQVQNVEKFSPTAFFLVLLPPIIFESGYNLHKGNFFTNLGSILLFAIVGTTISALVVGGGVYLMGLAGLVYQLNFEESFAFGSLISAVDPVATLAIFQALDVDPVLNMLVFGESILNDAVAIVLTTTIVESSFSAESGMSTTEQIANGIKSFIVTFLGSAGIGTLIGLSSSLLLKFVDLYCNPSLEFALMLCFVYIPYALAEGIHLSGIMSILFCGICMSQYTHYNLSPVTQITMQQTMPLCNRFRAHQITQKMMVIMWFSGLRGAIAYALSLHLEFGEDTRKVLVTTTLVVVLFTTIILGGGTMPLMKYLESRSQPRNRRRRNSRRKEITLSKTRELGSSWESEHHSELTEEEAEANSSFNLGNKTLKGFLYYDFKFFRPFFTRRFTQKELKEGKSHVTELTDKWFKDIRGSPLVLSDSEEDIDPEQQVFSQHMNHLTVNQNQNL